MSNISRWRQSIIVTVAAGGTGYFGYRWWSTRQRESWQVPLANLLSVEERKAALEWRPPPRSELLNRLKGLGKLGEELSAEEAEFDLVIIGGGATGTGCALDGASRGLKVALVERGDFSSGTSSKSTKLVHGGVRYLEKAFLHFDFQQFQMVREALAERAIFLKIAPHLTEQLPIMLPIYKWWLVPYYWAGAKVYDLVAGGRNLDSSYYLNASRAQKIFPMLRQDKLIGAIVYHDGSQNDARTNVALALTAIQQGAIATNYTEVVGLFKEDLKDGRPPQIRGVIIRDQVNGDTFNVKCKGVVSAAGPFCDIIRRMDDPACEALVQPSAGTHIVFPSYYSPRQMGLIDPASSDGRAIFFLPWEGNTIAGTTDSPSELTFEPKASKGDIDFILSEVKRYLDPVIQVRQSDVLAAWSGLRPLQRDPQATSTQEIVRNHVIMVSPSGLITIAGGKWTTYRKMAEDTIDKAITQFSLNPRQPHSQTEKIALIGSHAYQPGIYIKLAQTFGLETDVAQHLAKSYGDRAWMVAALSPSSGRRWPLLGGRLIPWYPYLEGEVRYAARFEYAQTAVDILARRTRLAHLSCQAAMDALPRVIEIMASELGWDVSEQERQSHLAEQYLNTCGLSDINQVRAGFRRAQLEHYTGIYKNLLFEESSTWTRLPIRLAIQGWKEAVIGEEFAEPIDWTFVTQHADPERIGSVSLAEFLDGLSFLYATHKKITKLDPRSISE